jgi:hypothetical protein
MRAAAGPAGSVGKRLLAWVAILLLAGVVIWLLSERNARQYFLLFEDGLLSVKRGILAPVGRQAFKTDDPQLLQAYAPFKPPPTAQLPAEQAFDDRAGLDQALYELLARWAREDIASEKPELLERAMGFVARAERLAGISAAQREDLRALRAESGFFEARSLLERGLEAIRQARERLRLSAQSASPHAGDAGEALRALEPLLDQLHRTSKALASSGPRRPEAAPAPAPGTAPPPGDAK